MADGPSDAPSFPLQAISPLCQIIFSRALPRAPKYPLLDPRPGSSDEDDVRTSLLALALVSKEFYYTSRPWLWRLLRISRPRGWVGVVHKLGGEQPGIRVGSGGETFADGSVPVSRAVSPNRTSSGTSNGPITPAAALANVGLAALESVNGAGGNGGKAPANGGGGGGGGGPAGSNGGGGDSLQVLALQRTRSQSIERTSAFISAQLAALQTASTSHRSQAGSSDSPDSSPDRLEEARHEFSEGPSRRLERSPSRGSAIPPALRRGDSVGSHRRLTQSPERIGRSRVRGDFPGIGERGMSIDSLTVDELPVAPLVPPIPTTYEPLHVCYPSSPGVVNASDSAFEWPAPPSTVYAPTEYDDEEHPDMAQFLYSLNEAGLPTRLLSFDKFRTTGLQRSLDEGLTGRFVTADRLGLVLKGLGNLEAFGATEYMDSALNLANLISLFFRGVPHLPAFLRESDEWEHLVFFRPLIALDLTGVNSRVFQTALRTFVATFIQPEQVEDHGESGFYLPDYQPVADRIEFSIERLCLHSCKFISAYDLTAIISCCANLTHLDLSYTRISSLEEIQAFKLRSLSLARCTKLTGADITQFLLHPNRSYLRQLNLYGSMSFPSPLSAADVTTIFELSPAFTSKKLRYLDMSSSPINASHLALLQAQPQLVSLGLSHIPLLPLRDLTAFIKEKAPQIEILTLTNSTPEITRPANSAAGMVVVYSLLINPLTSSPLWFDLANPPPPPPGRLRVIELAAPLLKNLAKAKGAAWRVIRSNGTRGWLVDTSSGWASSSLTDINKRPPFPRSEEAPQWRRGQIPPTHPWRRYLCMLSDSDGKVDSTIGFHSRKMEVLLGEGLLAREGGLYSGHAFAND